MSDFKDRLENLVELRERGELTPADLRMLQEDDKLARAFIEALADNAEWRDLAGAVADQEAFKQAVFGRLKEDGASEFTAATLSKARKEGLLGSPAEGRSGARAPGRNGKRPKRVVRKSSINGLSWTAVAAGILLSSFLYFYLGGSTEPRVVARLGKQCRETTITRKGVSGPAAPGAVFMEGDLLQTGTNGYAMLRLIKGSTRIEVGKESSLTAAQGRDGQLFLLQKGTVKAQVSPQAPGEPLRIKTDQSTAAVMGTEFSLSALGHATCLAVSSGKVRLSQNQHPRSVEVEGGSCALDTGRPEGPILGTTGTLHITCDNQFQLFFNGVEIGSHDYWFSARKFFVPVESGRNVIAVKGVNTGGVGGLLVDLRWNQGGVTSSKNWKTVDDAGERWTESEYDDSKWFPAVECAPLGGGRWTQGVKDFPQNSKAMWIWADKADAPQGLFRYSFSGARE